MRVLSLTHWLVLFCYEMVKRSEKSLASRNSIIPHMKNINAKAAIFNLQALELVTFMLR